MKKNFIVAAALVFCICIAAAHAQMGIAPLKTYDITKEEQARLSKTTVVVETKFGPITLKFFPDVAPQHVKNFVELAKKGIYDNTVFHRVAQGFMIQGGDPTSKDPARERAYGTGGPGYTIKAEFNTRPHKRGTLSMARTNLPDTAGSQFFICVQDVPQLNGQYTVFGEVVSGMEAVDKIVALQVPGSERPSERVEMKMKVVEEKK